MAEFEEPARVLSSGENVKFAHPVTGRRRNSLRAAKSQRTVGSPAQETARILRSCEKTTSLGPKATRGGVVGKIPPARSSPLAAPVSTSQSLPPFCHPPALTSVLPS